MLGQTVMCRKARQAFELPPEHHGDTVQCPLCGEEHPAPPIIPPQADRVPIVAGPPPIVKTRAQRLIALTTLALTFACGAAAGVLAGLAIAAATMPTASEFKATIAGQRADLAEAALELDRSRTAEADLSAEIANLQTDLDAAHERIQNLESARDDERKLADENFALWKKAQMQLDIYRRSRRR